MLGHRWQPTLGHCNFARRRNVGPTLVCQQRTNVCPTVRQRYGPTLDQRGFLAVYQRLPYSSPNYFQPLDLHWGFIVAAYLR